MPIRFKLISRVGGYKVPQRRKKAVRARRTAKFSDKYKVISHGKHRKRK